MAAAAVESALIQLVEHTLFEPLVTAPALWLILRGPPQVQEFLANLPFGISKASIALVVKVLLGAGIVGRINRALNAFSYRNWEFFYSGAPWVWKDEVCVVTGGSGGIAIATVDKLIPTGMKIALLDVQPPRADLLKLPNVKFYQCDLTSPKAIHEAAEAVRASQGKPSILVNNAGLGNGASIIDLTDAQLERIFRVNVMAHWITVREFLPDMIKAKKGHVLTVASMASFTAVAGAVDYSATKAGALAFHEGLIQELRHVYEAPFIQTTCAHPFWTKTAMTAPIEEGIKMSDSLMTPEYVGGVLAKAILSGKGGHLIIPPNSIKLRLAPISRGLPSWIGSMANDSTKHNILTDLRKGALEYEKTK